MDYGHTQTDKLLAKLEKRIGKEYDEARKSVKKKAKKMWDRYQEQYKEKKLLLEQGLITKAELKEWKQHQIARHNWYVDMQEALEKDIVHANAIATGLINNSNIDVYALNMNYGTYDIENQLKINTSFTLYDHDVVERLIKDGNASFAQLKQDIPKDMKWNAKHINSAITQGILAGDSIPQFAERLMDITDMNESAAIRNARTWTTSAENAGKLDAMTRAEGLGIQLGKQWLATLDKRTRDTHVMLDGEIVKTDEKFSNGCMYPADPAGPPKEIYNCRCRLITALGGMNNDVSDLSSRFSRLPEGMSYDDWKDAHDITGGLQMKIEGVQQKITDLKSNVIADFYAGIWKDPVTIEDYPDKKASIQSKKDYYENKAKYLENQYNNGIIDDAEFYAKQQEIADKLKLLEQYEIKGEEYLQALNGYQQEIKGFQAEIDKISGGSNAFGPDAYSQARKDAAIWSTDKRYVDGKIRERTGEVWRDATASERDAIYEYTRSFHKYNEPLRGYEYGTSRYLGVGNTDLNAGSARNGKRLNDMTSIIGKCSYDQDIWMQRGCGYGGMDKFLQVDMDVLQYGTEQQLQNALLGKTITEYGFMSCGTAKGQGFNGNVLFNVYAPKGTHMMYAEPFSQYGAGSGSSWDGVKKQSSFGSEFETIIQQGTQFRVTKVERPSYGGTIYVDIEVIGELPHQLYQP